MKYNQSWIGTVALIDRDPGPGFSRVLLLSFALSRFRDYSIELRSHTPT
jgi:hypothetical protein